MNIDGNKYNVKTEKILSIQQNNVNEIKKTRISDANNNNISIILIYHNNNNNNTKQQYYKETNNRRTKIHIINTNHHQ